MLTNIPAMVGVSLNRGFFFMS